MICGLIEKESKVKVCEGVRKMVNRLIEMTPIVTFFLSIKMRKEVKADERLWKEINRLVEKLTQSKVCE
jgi:hypothetical protein